MSSPNRWASDPHIPTARGDTCGHRNPRNGHRCNRPSGHGDRHAWAWQHIPTRDGAAGRVRDVWD